jgi:hypothetical protein
VGEKLYGYWEGNTGSSSKPVNTSGSAKDHFVRVVANRLKIF